MWMGSSVVLASRGDCFGGTQDMLRDCFWARQRATWPGLGDFPSDTRWGVWILRLISHFVGL